MITATLPKIAKELSGLDHVPVSSLEPYQGELKDLTEREYNKLLKSIDEHGFFLQFFAWPAPDGNTYILDGHQRKRVFEGEGWKMDVPVQYIEAKSYEDAKKKLLVITSQYGRVTQEGWDDFTFDLEDSWLQETVQFDALPLVFSDYEPPAPPDEWKEYDESAADDVEWLECPECGHKWPK